MSAATGHIPIRVSAVAANATRTDITAGRADEFRLTCDEPPERHGNNEGMLPLEAFLSGYVACSNVILNMIAAELDIRFDELNLRATGYLNPKGYLGIEQIKAPFSRVTLQVTGKASGNLSKLEQLKSQLRWRCPAAATFQSAGTDVQETWNLEEA